MSSYMPGPSPRPDRPPASTPPGAVTVIDVPVSLRIRCATPHFDNDEVVGTITVQGVEVWRATYPPGTGHRAVLTDMLDSWRAALPRQEQSDG